MATWLALEEHEAAQRRPDRLARLPEQYFVALRRLVEAAAGAAGEPLVDLSRGNPEVGPPPHVVDALCTAAHRRIAHGYASPHGLPELKEALAERYRSLYGVELDPEREVAVVPGTKTAIAELALVLADGGRKVVLPDPGYPDYLSGVALAGARAERARLDAADSYAPDFDSLPRDAAALYLNYPSNPCAACAPQGVFDDAVRWAEETGTVVVHDSAYADDVLERGLERLAGAFSGGRTSRGRRRSAPRDRPGRGRTPPPCTGARRACRRGSRRASAASRPRPAGSTAAPRTRAAGASSRAGRRRGPGSGRGGRR